MAFTVNIANLQIALDDGWDDPIQKSQYLASCESVKTVLENQTAKVDPLIEGVGTNAKKLSKTIHWQNTDNITVVDRTDECAVSAIELTDASKTYTLDTFREASFVTSWKAHRTTVHELTETVANGILRADKELAEDINQKLITFLAANNGVHEYTGFANGANNGVTNVWEIAAANWDSNLIPEFILAAKFGRFGMPMMLHGLNLWKDFFTAERSVQNADGKGEKNILDAIPMYWDPIGFTDGSVSDQSFLVNKSAVAVATGNYFSNPVTFGGNHRMYSIQSRNLPGVSWDVHEQETCSGDDFKISWKIVANFGVFLNPQTLNADRTGILQFAST